MTHTNPNGDSNDNNDDAPEMHRLWGYGSNGSDDVSHDGHPTSPDEFGPDERTGWGADDSDDDRDSPDSPLQPDDGFYHCGVHVEEGRLFVDPDIDQENRYVAIKEIVDAETMEVWVMEVQEDPNGPLESNHERFSRVSPAFKRDWTEVYGRLIPR